MEVPLVVLIFCVFAKLVSGETFPVEDGVLVLNPSNFKAAVARFPNLMVEFYAPWCRHCQALAPKYANAAKQLQRSGSPVKLAKLDAIRYAAFAGQHGVSGYPTLMFYRDGAPTEYDGAHEQGPIVQWVQRNARYSRQVDQVVELTMDDFEATVMKNPFVMVKFHAPWCPHCQELAPKYSKAAAELVAKDHRVILAEVDVTKEKELAVLHGIRRYPTLKFFRYGVPEVYEGARTQRAIVEWILNNARSAPSVPEAKKTKEVLILTTARSIPSVPNVKKYEEVLVVQTSTRKPTPELPTYPVLYRSGDFRAEREEATKNEAKNIIPVMLNLLAMITICFVLMI